MSLLRLQNLKVYFTQRYGIFKQHKAITRAVDGIDLEIYPGETLGLVGESGCGKSTLGKAILRLHPATSGSIRFRDLELGQLTSAQLRPVRASMQMVFQDPFESLNPRHTVANIIEEPLIIHRRGDNAARKQRVQELITLVGLDSSALDKYPHEFSGGQRQRIGIARAIALEPDLLICDEAVSALDVSVQAQIINLLVDIQQKMGLSMLFISHDLSVVRHISDRIAVMYKGRIVEVGDSGKIHQQPSHPYTRTLLDAIPRFNQPWHDIPAIKGEISDTDHSPGCAFAPRCPHADAHCRQNMPLLANSDDTGDHQVACFKPLRLDSQQINKR